MPHNGRMTATDSVLDAYRTLAQRPDIFTAVAAAADDPLRAQTLLRSQFPAELVRLALTVAELRERATRKFPQAGLMWFDRARLEQATPHAVAVHTAQRFSGPVWDFCSGAGADAVALAAAGCSVTAVDADPLACLLTDLNATVLGVADRVQTRCQRVEEVADAGGGLHIDPDRRAGASKRAVRVEDYVPGLDTLRSLMTRFAGGAVKLSPASNFGGKFDDLDCGVEIELVSVAGECKAATVWFGELATPQLWRASVLPGSGSVEAPATLAGDPLEFEPQMSPLDAYLFDPDPAVVRAGLIDSLCGGTRLARLDLAEEYLTGPAPLASPFVTGFRVVADLPNNERAVRAYLRTSNVGRLEIKARRLRVDIPRLHRTLPTPGDQPGVLIFARVAGKARAIVASRAS